MLLQQTQRRQIKHARRFTPKTAKWILLPALIGTLCLTAGCKTQTADASDPDPHYYKGTDFHGKPKKA